MADMKTGDRVRIKTREVTTTDLESGYYFRHYGGMEGEVARVFADDIAVRMERESLGPDVRKMHEHIEQRVKDKFLTGLSEEGRKRLSPEERSVNLNFVVLVHPADLEPLSGAKPAPAKKEEPPARKTAEELERAEEEYLRSRHPD